MGMACVCEQVFTVKIVHIREGRIGQDTDMDGRKKLAVILSALYVAEKAAEIEKRAVAPVIEMPHLHLQVDQTVVVQFYTPSMIQVLSSMDSPSMIGFVMTHSIISS